MATSTRLDLVKALARAIGHYRARPDNTDGVITSAAATTITDTTHGTWNEDELNGSWLVLSNIAAGGSSYGLGHARKIIATSYSNKQLTVATAFSTTPAASDTYFVILQPIWPGHLITALNTALDTLVDALPVFDNTIYRPDRRERRIDFAVTQWSVVEITRLGSELGTNGDFRDSATTGWTVHANSALANDASGDASYMLKHVATGSGEVDSFDVTVASGQPIVVGADLIGTANGVAVNYQFLNSAGTVLNSTPIAVTSSPVTATSMTVLRTENVVVPENATTIRVRFSSNGSGTYYIRRATVQRYEPGVPIPHSGLLEDEQGRYVELHQVVDGDVRVRGVVGHTEMTADTSTVGVDSPEVRLLIAESARCLYEQYGHMLMTQEATDQRIAYWARRVSELRRLRPAQTVTMGTVFRQPFRTRGW